MENKKRKPGFLDIVVILVILAIIGGAVYYFSHNNVGKSATASGNQEITYVITLRDAGKDIEKQAVIGDSVYYAESGDYIGELVAVKRVPYQVEALDETTGNMTNVDIEGKYSAEVTVKATATITESETTVNGVQVMVGAELPFKTSTFGGAGYGMRLEEPNYD